jgi:hypothetical protein
MKARFYLDVEFNGRRTDGEGVAAALDRVVETGMSALGDCWDEYGGQPKLGQFLVLDTAQAAEHAEEEKAVASYTYDDLANDIAKLTPDQRKQPVRLLEPYDDAACLAVVSLAVATDQVANDDDEVLLDEGQVYLQS